MNMAKPKVSIVLAVHNGLGYIEESIESILAQTYSDWEFIIVNEFDSDDGCADIVKEYAREDKRIRLIQNTKKLGLSESLNVGIHNASGQYIARVDVDDPSYKERLEKQVQYLDENPDVFMCGTLQRSVLPDSSYILEVPCEAEELKTAMLFGCEISHCSVMFRKDTWINEKMKYNKESLCEDYDLWTRIMFKHKIVNLPETLVDHRWGFDNISIAKGERLHKASRDVSRRTLEMFGVQIEEGDDFLVAGWRNEPKKFARMNPSYFIRKNYWLLSEIETQNTRLKLIEEKALKKILWKRWNWVCRCLGLFFKEFSYDEIAHIQNDNKPKVSIVMPVYQAVNTIRETIDSILLQTYSSWEFIIVCEYENWDGSTELAKYYAKLDGRIKIICNEKQEGLAEALNIGMRAATGKYIARIDADDLANAARIASQVEYMEKHPDIGLTQFYQHYFGAGANDFIHRPPVTVDDLKAKLLFFCDACHSTIMFRKSIVEKYDLYYNPQCALEDFELWSRAIQVTNFVTIPEIYGEYRVGGDNISYDKEKQIERNMCETVASQLRCNLKVDISENNYYLLNGWTNIFNTMAEKEKNSALNDLQTLLLEIWSANEQYHFYNRKSLQKAIAAKWNWSKYNISWHEEQEAAGISNILELGSNKLFKQKLFQCFIRKPLSAIQSFHLHTQAKSIEHLSNVSKDVASAQVNLLDQKIEWWTWERYKRIENKLEVIQKQNEELQRTIADIRFESCKIPYVKGEKIRIAFLYQVASFWASWESLYQACMNNPLIDARIIFLDETNVEKSQMQGAEQFLLDNDLPYTKFEDESIEEFMPHILIIQTPYDEWHRKNVHWSGRFKQMGYRLVYIPYGVEISDTEDSHELHFRTNVIENCWRIYTFSDVMKRDYYKYSSNRKAIRAVGLPRFDYYTRHTEKCLPANVEQRRLGRKIVVWKVHFPKTIIEKGMEVFVTPDLNEYLAFAKKIKDFSDYFFIFIPHPKFFEDKGRITDDIKKIVVLLSEYENVWIDYADDYRKSLQCADYVIIDRSAVMVEAGALNVPVCYVSNKQYYEPLTRAIRPLIESYYQANDCEGMISFLNNQRTGREQQKLAQQKIFGQCIPFFDGNSGERVLQDMIDGVVNNEN